MTIVLQTISSIFKEDNMIPQPFTCRRSIAEAMTSQPIKRASGFKSMACCVPLLAVMVSCSQTSSPTPAPVASSLTPGSGQITAGHSTSLTPVFTNGTGVIDNNIGSVTSGTPVTVSPVSTTTYTLSVTNADGVSASKTALISVLPAPAITSFTVSPTSILAGQNVTMNVAYSNGSGTVDNGVGPVSQGIPSYPAPQVNTTYTLTVDNGAGGTATMAASPITVQSTGMGLQLGFNRNITPKVLTVASITVAGPNGFNQVYRVSGQSWHLDLPAAGTYTITASAYMDSQNVSHSPTTPSQDVVVSAGVYALAGIQYN